MIQPWPRKSQVNWKVLSHEQGLFWGKTTYSGAKFRPWFLRWEHAKFLKKSSWSQSKVPTEWRDFICIKFFHLRFGAAKNYFLPVDGRYTHAFSNHHACLSTHKRSLEDIWRTFAQRQQSGNKMIIWPFMGKKGEIFFAMSLHFNGKDQGHRAQCTMFIR